MKYIILSFLSLIGFQAISQESLAKDTLWYLNGDYELISKYRFSEDSTLLGYINKKGKQKEVERFFVFSIHESNGNEIVVYNPNAEGMNPDVSVENMRAFVEGGHIARKNYNGNFALIEGVLVGMASPWAVASVHLNPFYSVLIPAANTFVVGLTKPSQKKIIEKYPKKSQNQFFVDGFTESAKRKRIKKSIIGGVVGIAAGIASVFILLK